MKNTILLTQTLHNNINKTNALYDTVTGMKKENAECNTCNRMEHNPTLS